MPISRFFTSLILLGAGFSAGAEPGPQWLRACDKRDPSGLVIAPGMRVWEDAPVRGDLQDSLRTRGWKVRTTLRWANLISAVPPAFAATLPACLEREQPVAQSVRSPSPITSVAARSVSVDPAPVTLRRMHDTLGVTAFQEALRTTFGQEPGQGIRVAIMDDGFVLQHRALQNAKVVDAWDYVSNDSVPWDIGAAPWAWAHGTATTSLIASTWDAILPGIAPSVSLLLYRTEDDDREVLAEEDYLANAIERAVTRGAKVISTSLGYRYAFDNGVPDFPFSSMDGRTLVASRTASWAAGRDVVVVVAIGNEGEYGSRSLNSPADADSILAVGAVSESHLRCDFSSQGPSADGRIKPDLVAFGCTVPVATGTGPNGYYEGGEGTSYAAPMIAGMAALLRQYHPDWTAGQVRDSLKKSGSLASTPDTLRGWGVPDLRRFLGVRGAGNISSHPVLPSVWRPSRGALQFRAGTPSERFEFVFRSLGGRVLHRSSVSPGQSVWAGSPPPGTYVASWSVPGGGGSSIVIVTDR